MSKRSFNDSKKITKKQIIKQEVTFEPATPMMDTISDFDYEIENNHNHTSLKKMVPDKQDLELTEEQKKFMDELGFDIEKKPDEFAFSDDDWQKIIIKDDIIKLSLFVMINQAYHYHTDKSTCHQRFF